jgi:hypothetical protein
MKSARGSSIANTTMFSFQASFQSGAEAKSQPMPLIHSAGVHAPVHGMIHDSWGRIPISPWFTMNSIHLRQCV